MNNEPNTTATYSLRELVDGVSNQYEGLFEIPNSELTVGDDRFFNLLEINHQENEKILVLSTLEKEQDYLVVGPNEVQWTDNWSGEDKRIYKGNNVQDNFKISFDEETFQVHPNDLEFSKKPSAPVFEIDMGVTNVVSTEANSNELNR